MERLTARNKSGEAYYPECFERCDGIWNNEKCSKCNVENQIRKKLAAYEDLGLTLEQIQEIDRLYSDKCKELVELKEYHDLEEKGLLLRLPCKAGDTVYILSHIVPKKRLKIFEERYFIDERKILPARVVNVSCLKDRKYIKIAVQGETQIVSRDSDYKTSSEHEYCVLKVAFSNIGNIVFLTIEEAEAKLEELRCAK